jgi:hypothetical protein
MAKPLGSYVSSLAAGVALGLACMAASGDTADAQARIVCTREITGGALPVAGGEIPVGGISDLCLEPETLAGERRLWAVTDRGPNGLGHDERGYNSDASTALAADADGVDPEGVVAMGDDGFWLVEEYRPSILRVAADGTLMVRHVPTGDALPGAEAAVVANLPPRYAGRAKNRGFEAVTLAADLAPLLPAMREDVFGGSRKKNSPLKLEGLAIVDATHVLLANDNDFGVADAGVKAKTPPRSCLWLIELSEPMVLDPQT